jgi:quinohemoprotein amine dehydrogenase
MSQAHGVVLDDGDRAAVLEYLADNYGLAPSEASSHRAFLERVPSVQDQIPDPLLSSMCARCHSFARIALERRDQDEWLKLSNFHLGQFPSAEYSGEARNIEWWKLASNDVPALLGKMYPFSTPEWTAWRQHANPRLAGIWRVTGHRPGRGDYQGTMQLRETATNHYDLRVRVAYARGSLEEGTGEAIVYTGYEWRAGLTSGKDSTQQVAEIGPDGGLSGRWFMENRPERGGTLKAYRQGGPARILSVTKSYLRAGEVADLAIDGVSLSGPPAFGPGVRLLRILSQSTDRIVVRAKADEDATDGVRTVSVGNTRAEGALVIYRKIDFVDVIPANTIARVGGNGGRIPPVAAQFEAVAYLAATDSDQTKAVRIGIFPASWSISPYDDEAKARRDDYFAGRISPMGEFQPAGAGPNPKRKFSGNNVGNLRVMATVSDGTTQVTGDAHLIVTVQRWITQPIL